MKAYELLGIGALGLAALVGCSSKPIPADKVFERPGGYKHVVINGSPRQLVFDANGDRFVRQDVPDSIRKNHKGEYNLFLGPSGIFVGKEEGRPCVETYAQLGMVKTCMFGDEIKISIYDASGYRLRHERAGKIYDEELRFETQRFLRDELIFATAKCGRF